MTTTFYDRRAEREVASAVAEQHRADAAGRLADVELRRVEVEAARADLAERKATAEQARKAAHRAQSRASRAVWWEARRASVGRVRARLVAVLPLLVGAVAMGSPVLIGWDGQLRTAQTVLHLGPLAWVFPVALEGGAWWLAYLTHQAIAAHLPTGRLRLVTWVLAGVAAGMNIWSGTVRFGAVGGVCLGLASLLGIGLWEITAWHRRQHVAGRSASSARQAWLRRLRFPLLSLAAASRSAALGEGTGETAWRAAWIDRYGVGPDATRRQRRLARLVHRHDWKADRDAAKQGRLVVVNGVILRTADRPPALPEVTADSSPTPPETIPAESPNTPSERGEQPDQATQPPKLSPSARTLLKVTRAAITDGRLKPQPSAYAINKECKTGGMPAAAQVRDYLKAMTTAKESA
jgi:hypothetical protein